jgi:hypothetical protein
MVVFRPFVGEILEGKILFSSQQGVHGKFPGRNSHPTWNENSNLFLLMIDDPINAPIYIFFF